MGLDGLLTDHELRGDTAVGQPGHHQRQDLALPLGQAVPGAWVTVSFNGDPDDTDVFQLVLPADAKPLGDTCSVECPLGKALVASHVGETRRYVTESGRSMAITVLAVDSVNPQETAGR